MITTTLTEGIISDKPVTDTLHLNKNYTPLSSRNIRELVINISDKDASIHQKYDRKYQF